MSLNISIKGTAYDENNNPIDCNFQMHYVSQGVWNDVRSTTSAYYSANAGDADSLTQTGTLLSGDKVLVTFWQGDGVGGSTSLLRDGIFDRFAVYEIIYDGATADYVFDVQLKPKTVPVASWYLPSTGTINHTVTASNNSNDRLSWSFGSITLQHINTLSGVVVFPSVGNLTTTYDWNDINAAVTGFETPNTHIFTVVNDYNVTIKLINAWSLVTTDTLPIRLKYNAPVPHLYFTPDGVTTKIHTTEDVVVTADITDVDSRISSILHRWLVNNRDTGSTIFNVEVGVNTLTNYTYTQTINLLQKHYGIQEITWNDGWVDITISYTRELIITNWLPLVNFEYIFLNDSKVSYTPNCSDLDGTVDNYEWKLYSLVPFTTGSYTLANTYTYPDATVFDVTFNTPGHYKMVLTATDDYGESASFSKEFDIVLGGNCVSSTVVMDDVFFIIPDEIEY